MRAYEVLIHYKMDMSIPRSEKFETKINCNTQGTAANRAFKELRKRFKKTKLGKIAIMVKDLGKVREHISTPNDRMAEPS